MARTADPADLNNDGRVSDAEKTQAAALAAKGYNPDGTPMGSTQPVGSTAAPASSSGGVASDVANADPKAIAGAGNAKGAPIFPFTVPTDGSGNPVAIKTQLQYGYKYVPGQGLVQHTEEGPPRYYALDAFDPLNWGSEKIANLQKVFYQIGLYGAKGPRLGTWTATDQKLYTTLLGQSNMSGMVWQDQLADWMKNPPADLIAATAKPTVTVSNPLDIQQVARTVSQSLLGKEDAGFVASSAPAVQGQEAAAQNAAFANTTTDASGNTVSNGGTDVQAPSPTAVLTDKLKREQPLAVDGHSFVNKFQSFLGMLGAQGGEHG